MERKKINALNGSAQYAHMYQNVDFQIYNFR